VNALVLLLFSQQFIGDLSLRLPANTVSIDNHFTIAVSAMSCFNL